MSYSEKENALGGFALNAFTVTKALSVINNNNWIRIGLGNKGGGIKNVFRISLGAGKPHFKSIKNPYLRKLNIWLRGSSNPKDNARHIFEIEW